MSYSVANSGGRIDASIPLEAGQIGAQQPNPLQQIGQFANTLNAINQTKMFPGEIQRQKQAIALGDQAVQGGDVDLHTKINQAAYGSIIPLLALPPGTITHDSLTSALAGSEKNLGIPTHGVLQNFIDNPMPDGPQFDAYVRARIAAGAQPYHAAAGQVTPQAGPVISTGQAEVPTTVSPAGSASPGQVAPTSTSIPTYPSRGSLLQQVTWEDSSGVKHYGTQADWAKARGQDALIGPTTPAAGGAPVAGAQPGAAPAPLSGNGHYQSATPPTEGPAPGTVENSTASALSAHSANQRASTFASDMFPLQAAQTALANSPTGKGSQAVHDASAYINTFAPPWVQKGLSFISPIMTADQQASYDEAKKYTTQTMLGAPGATRSNEGQAAAGAANPSVDISPAAAQLVLKGMSALRRMEQDATLNFNQSGLPPKDYDKFQTQFATKADPRVYMFDQISPDERKQTLSSFKDSAKRNAFISQVERAEKNGVLSAPGASNAQ